MIGTRFNEMICQEMGHLTLRIRYLGRSEMDPFKAAKKVNEKVGSVVCEMHDGILVAYDEVGPEQSIVVKKLERIPTYITPLKVKYADGHEGYTYLCRFVVKKDGEVLL